MHEKITDITNNDLPLLDISLSEISAAAASTYSYLDNLTLDDPCRKSLNTVLDMLYLIRKLAEKADNDLLGVMDKLVCFEKAESGAAQ